MSDSKKKKLRKKSAKYCRCGRDCDKCEICGAPLCDCYCGVEKWPEQLEEK